jgi:LysM repeat protein
MGIPDMQFSFYMRHLVRLAGLTSFAALLAIAATVFAAPSEQDIGPSPRSTVSRNTGSATDDETPAAAKTFKPAAISPAPNAETPSAAQPRATFPYTIRAGDTLDTIASAFGISVSDLARLNRLSEDSELEVGETLRIPNPFLARERELTTEIDRLSIDKQTSDQRAEKAESALASTRERMQDLTAANDQYSHELRTLPWWRGAAMATAAAAVLMLGVMLLALVEWWILRNSFRAVAMMNESLRRLDFKYKTALAKAELRLQELYGRRRRGIQDGQERQKMPEELEIDELNRELKEVLEHHLARLGPPGAGARRALWRERVSGIGSPVEARTLRR